MRDLLTKELQPEVVVVGVGNSLRGDDGVGPFLVQMLQKRVEKVIDAGEVPESYSGKILDMKPATVLFVDAVELGAGPGSVVLLKPEDLSQVSFSSHRMSLKLFMNFLQREGNIRVLLLGFQPKDTTLGRTLSAEVKESLEAVHRILEPILKKGSTS